MEVLSFEDFNVLNQLKFACLQEISKVTVVGDTVVLNKLGLSYRTKPNEVSKELIDFNFFGMI